MQTPEAREIPLAQIRFVFRRNRNEARFKDMKASMKEAGRIYMPIQVRDLGRIQPDGKRYELIMGEGRCTAAEELKWETITGLVMDVKDSEYAGRFLAENMLRANIPWQQKGRYIRDQIKAGVPIDAVAASLHISEARAKKYLAILDRVARPEDIEEMNSNDAELFTALPAKGQTLVMEVYRETQVPIRDLTRIARRVERETGKGMTKHSIIAEIERVDRDLKRVTNNLKWLRLQEALGPVNLRQLLRDKAFRKACEDAKLNVEQFL